MIRLYVALSLLFWGTTTAWVYQLSKAGHDFPSDWSGAYAIGGPYLVTCLAVSAGLFLFGLYVYILVERTLLYGLIAVISLAPFFGLLYMKAGTEVGEYKQRVAETDEALDQEVLDRINDWETYDKRLIPEIVKHIASQRGVITYPYGDERARIAGLARHLDEAGVSFPMKGDAVFDPWGNEVLILFDRDYDSLLVYGEASQRAWNETGNRLYLGLYTTSEPALPSGEELKFNPWQTEYGHFPYPSRNSTVTIPSHLLKPAFSQTALLNVALPPGVTVVYSRPFSGTDFEELVLPASVREIREGAFRGCKQLRRIELPEGLLQVGPRAFFDCERLTDVTLPSTVTEIGDGAFGRCSSIERLSLPPGLPDIPDALFRECPALQEVIVPDSVRTVGRHAFAGCSRLEEVDLPAEVTNLGKGAFEGCSNLLRVKLPTAITEIEEDTFRDCIALTAIQLPPGLTRIGEAAFFQCDSLETLRLPPQLGFIGESAFMDCDQLSSVHLPPGLTHIGPSAFAGCANLESVRVSPEQAGKASELPATGVIGDFAFRDCVRLATVSLPDTIQRIGTGGFQSCTLLRRIQLPRQLIEIGSSAFWMCESLENPSLPPTLTVLGDGAFMYCQSLTNLTLPEQLATLGKNAFNGCGSLQSINIPDGITEIREGTFKICTKLEDLRLSPNLTSIGDVAFYRCAELTEVTIPENVRRIGIGAFAGCEKLTRVHLEGDAPQLGDKAFETGTTTFTYASGRSGYDDPDWTPLNPSPETGQG